MAELCDIYEMRPIFEIENRCRVNAYRKTLTKDTKYAETKLARFLFSTKEKRHFVKLYWIIPYYVQKHGYSQ